jgi:prepilin-type processing-associated H-X9-DG protein
LFADGHWNAATLYWNDHLNQGSMPDPIHSGGLNVLYFDGHAALIQWAAVPPVVSTPEGKAFWLGQ